MGGLTWLHLSDWHQGENDFDRQVVLSALLKDVRERANISPSLNKIDFIIFSGDVAFSGKPDQYQAAKSQLFQPILDACGLTPSQLFIVPGNHDLDMNLFRYLPGELSKPLTSEGEVQNWLIDDRGRSGLLEPFQAFKEFINNFTGQKQPDYANVQKWQIDDKKIAILGLNSAWMCGRNKNPDGKINDKGFAIVGEPQIQNYVDQIADADIRIAVLHHPFDWLAEFDCDRIESRMRQSFNFILRGHQHRPKVEVIHGTSGDSIIIPAGSCYNRRLPENPQYANSYNFVHLDFDSGSGTVFLRRWSDPRTKWIEDIDSFDYGKFEFRLFESKSTTSSQPFESTRKSTQIIPHQIPPPPADFKGREDEINDILANFEKGATITGLYGMGGIGKTALALVLAEKLKDRFPDGQIFIEMRGTSKNPNMPPVAPEEAMAHVIRAYNPIDRLPDNRNELRGLYYSALAGKRVFLLLDNAADSHQVEPLLPPADCSVLITSRIKFTLPRLVEKDLEILPSDKALELLLDIAPRIGDRANEIARLCGYLPIALRNAAGVLAENVDLSVTEYLRRLRNAKKRLDLVDASFGLSYALLQSDKRALWCILAVFPADFDRAGAASVWNIELDETAEALSELVRWSLVNFSSYATSEEGRYRLHDLARLYASSRLDSDALSTAQYRHAAHYQSIYAKATDLYINGNVLQGLALFDAEWSNIQAGQTWTREKLKTDNQAAALCSRYANWPYLLELRLHPLEMIEWFENALAAALRLEDCGMEGVQLGNLGLAYFYVGEYHKAIEYHEQALTIARRIGERRQEGVDLGNLGLTYYSLGEYRKAINYHEQALKISRELGNRRQEGVDLGNLGLAYRHLGEYRKAIEYHEHALIIAREIGDRRQEGVDLGNLGLAFYSLGEHRKAIDYHEQALIIAREIGDRRSQGRWVGNLGLAYRNLGEYHKAIEYHEQALTIFREIGDRRREGHQLGNLGLAYRNLGEYRRAVEYHEQALSIARRIGDKRSEGSQLGNLGITYSDRGDFREAIEYHEQALALSRKIGNRHGEGANLGNLGSTYSGLGEIDKAMDYYNGWLAIAQEIGDRSGEGNALWGQAICYEKMNDLDKAIGKAREALDVFEQIESPSAPTMRGLISKMER
jgi:tetratricopeptide (TPR) repeat protein/3',5'-cyclic AMP phosphodiesterase CpdA